MKQEVSAEEHHDGIVHTKHGPVHEDGPLQQRVLGNVSEGKHHWEHCERVVLATSRFESLLINMTLVGRTRNACNKIF